MSDNIKELVKRLRATMNWGGSVGVRPINQDGPEAADALEALAGEVENLRHDVARHMGIANAAEAERDELANWKASFLHENEQILASNEQLAAERDRLKAALETVRQYVKGGPDHVSDDDITAVFSVVDAALRAAGDGR